MHLSVPFPELCPGQGGWGVNSTLTSPEPSFIPDRSRKCPQEVQNVPRVGDDCDTEILDIRPSCIGETLSRMPAGMWYHITARACRYTHTHILTSEPTRQPTPTYIISPPSPVKFRSAGQGYSAFLSPSVTTGTTIRRAALVLAYQSTPLHSVCKEVCEYAQLLLA